MLHNFKSLNILHHMVNSVEFGGYANDDNRRAERWMMGSLGTPGDQPRNFWKKGFQTETFENSEDGGGSNDLSCLIALDKNHP